MVMAAKKDRTSEHLEKLGKKIVSEIEELKSPSIDIPVRALSNIEYNKDSGLLTVGEQMAKRYFLNVAHTRKFMQTLMVAKFCHQDLLKEGIHTSLRDMYYALKRTLPGTNENTFEEQGESDPCVVDLEVALDVLREDLHLNADVRGRVAGAAVIEDRGDSIDLAKLGSGGWAIPSNVEDVDFKKVDAKFVFVVEKNAAFDRMHEDKFWQKNKCILIGTQGQPARGARRLIHRLSEEHKLPVLVFTDADAYGWYIYSVIKCGSMNLAHTSNALGTPEARFVGLTISDVEKYGLKKFTIKAKDVDVKRANELLNYEWFKAREWQDEIKKMIDRGYKAELEALSSRGLKFMTETYLPEKIKSKDFLP